MAFYKPAIMTQYGLRVPQQLIQSRYHTHRTTRNQQQKEKILSSDFSGWILDPILTKLNGPQSDPDFEDPRNCLVFWARPTEPIKAIINTIQQRLQNVVPGIWLMPLPNLHMTAMEVTHSLTAPAIDDLVEKLLPTSHTIADLPSTPNHAARLIKPMVSFDAAALALSFVPAASEGLPKSSTSTSTSASTTDGSSRSPTDDTFTYHHLRRTLHSLISDIIPVASRYVVPSAHLTIARFNAPNPFATTNSTTKNNQPSKQDSNNTSTVENDPLNATIGTSQSNRDSLINEIESINAWLQAEYWPTYNVQEPIPIGGEWVVGEEKGLDFRKGTLWYGGGETVYLGKGIGE